MVQSVPGEAVKSYIRYIGPDGVQRYGQPEAGICPKVPFLSQSYFQCEVRVIDGDVFGECKLSNTMDVALKILPPIEPTAIYGIGLNYKKHAAVMLAVPFVVGSQAPHSRLPCCFHEVRLIDHWTVRQYRYSEMRCCKARSILAIELQCSLGGL